MQSRKSSILKPRKVREPLQDLNQLLPNNDDDETTTTDAQRRRVSFASMNKVKEYETAPECVVVAPPVYDKRYSLSTDLCQPPIPGNNANETYQTTNVSRKSIQSCSKVNTVGLSVSNENIYIEEDVELTETIGRIYDIPMKSSGDSSMEMTHVITQNDIQYDEQSKDGEVLGPLNLTKETFNQTGSFTNAHIVEIEVVKNEKDADTSSMETTEVLSNNVIQIENRDSGTLSMETTEVIRNNVIRIEKSESDAYSMDMTEVISPNFDKNGEDSSMETTDVICDNMLTESIKSQSVFFETIQSSQAFDTTNQEEDVEYVSVPNFESPGNLPKRKSIFEISTRPSTNWEITQNGNLNRNKNNLNCSSIKLVNGDDSKLVVCNDSLSLTCQEMANRIDDSIINMRMLNQEVQQRLNITNEPGQTENFVEELKFNTGIIRTSTQDTNKTKYDALSMQLLSQETEKNKSLSVSMVSLAADKTKCDNSNVELLTQEDNKTKYNNSNMELLSQEDNKTKCNNSNMDLLSQEENKTKYPNSNMELISQEDNKTKYNNSNMELLTQEEKTKCYGSAANSSVLEDAKNLDNSVRAPFAEEKSFRLSTSASPLIQDESEAAEKSRANLNLNEIATPMKPALSECYPESPNLPKIIPPEVDVFTEVESISEQVENGLPQPITAINVNDVPHETTLKSSQDDSSANDSNSPLTVGVNFSIFQKNKETRVEFSGTIDSHKKKKSISNVKVNIINNKTEKSNKHVKELRFSMPATTKTSLEVENKKPEFSATFTDFSIPNEDSSPTLNKTAAVEENKTENVAEDCPLSTEPEGPAALHSSSVFNDDMSNAHSAKPAKKRLSNDAFCDAEENKVSPKRRSLCTDAKDSQRVPETVSPTGTESSGSSASLVRRSITEIKQRRESFVREEKSILAVDNIIVETCSRSTNTNISFEARQLVSVTQQESAIEQNALTEEEQTSNPTTSFRDSSSNENTKEMVEECSKELAATNVSNVEFSDADHSHSLNQSSSQEEINDYSLHNPSIIVNVGDSFSHYKSMDLGTDTNDLASDVRALVANENDPKPVTDYIDTDDICKENFVVEWLQNKTGKTNVENKIFSSASDSSSLSTVKNMTRGSDKSNSTSISDTVRMASREDSQKTCPDTTTDLVENDAECNEGTEEKSVEMSQMSSDVASHPSGTENANTEPDVPEQTALVDSQAEEMEVNVDEIVDEVILSPKPEPVNVENSASLERVAAVEGPFQEEMAARSDQTTNSPEVSCGDDIIAFLNDDSNRMELSDGNDSNSNLIDEGPEATNISNRIPVISGANEVQPKLTSKTRLSVDPVFVCSESTSEKRQRMSPEFESNIIETEQVFPTCTVPKIEAEIEPVAENIVPVSRLESELVHEKNKKQNQQIMRPRNVFNVVSEDQSEKKVTKKLVRNQPRHRKFATTRKDILEKIEASKIVSHKWRLKVVSKDEWIFQFFYDQLELCIKFDGDEDNITCSATCQYVRPPYVKYYEICQIAVEYLIRKNELKLKKICQTVEDVPYLLKLIEPDVIYIENFVADIIRLCESEIFKIKNGRAVFYVYSLKNIVSAKIQINISRLERLSVKDIQVEEIVGKADLNSIRNTFSEVGRDSNFFSRFVNKLWTVLDE